MTDEEKTKTKIAELKSKHGQDVAIYHVLGQWLVFRTPEQEAFEDFMEAQVSDKERKTTAARSLCLRSILEPDVDALRDIFKKRPGLPVSIAARLNEMATGDAEDLAKKG